MSDRLTRADIDALIDNLPESQNLTTEFRARYRRYEYFRKYRKKQAGSRPPNTSDEEVDIEADGL